MTIFYNSYNLNVRVPCECSGVVAHACAKYWHDMDEWIDREWKHVNWNRFRRTKNSIEWKERPHCEKEMAVTNGNYVAGYHIERTYTRTCCNVFICPVHSRVIASSSFIAHWMSVTANHARFGMEVPQKAYRCSKLYLMSQVEDILIFSHIIASYHSAQIARTSRKYVILPCRGYADAVVTTAGYHPTDSTAIYHNP